VSGQYINENKKIMFNILDKETKLVIGHKLIGEDKKSEIAVFKELLDDKEFFAKGQVFSFDALTTQVPILDKINSDGNFYLAYVKGNQANLQKKIISTIDTFEKPTEIYEDDKFNYSIERNKYVHRKVEIYKSKNCDIVMFDSKFKNIQTLIKTIKTTTDKKTGEKKEIIKYMIANYKESAEDFKKRILQHWLVETNHFYLDTMFGEDDHNAYKNPFGMSILRSFALNLYQLYFNENKGEKIIVNGYKKQGKLTMAQLKHYCAEHDELVFELFEG
jgi:predicted transposase YbfD/YdcC